LLHIAGIFIGVLQGWRRGAALLRLSAVVAVADLYLLVEVAKAA
jgi:hypothetical protein